MVSKALIKFTSPVAKSCLMAIGIALIIDAVLTMFAANSYPYLIAHTSELYVPDSRDITLLYSASSAAAVLLSLSTAWASYKSKTNYVLVHACITGVFLPVSILVYFSSLPSRYKVNNYVGNYRQMIADYRVNNQQIRSALDRQTSKEHSQEQDIDGTPSTNESNGESIIKQEVKFTSFINMIDSIQSNFACCGVDSAEDWTKQWDKYIPPTCCGSSSRVTSTNEKWAQLFTVDPAQEFHHCPESDAYHLGCLAALKDDEKSKFAWLADLIVFLMFMTITNTIVSLLLFGISKTEDMPYDVNEHELAMVGVSTKPRPSQPEITGIRHRPSVIAMGASKEQIASISQAVRFNLSNSPRASISGPSKFSAGARRGSAFV